MAFVIDDDEEFYNASIPDDYLFVNEYINTDDEYINTDDEIILDLIIKQTVSRFFSHDFDTMIFIQNFNFIKKN